MKILDYLKKNTSSTTKELANLFNVSENTIRRDLSYLEKQGLINRDRNGAMISSIHPETNFLLNYNKNKAEKETIAEKVLEIINEGELIAFSGGSTTYMAAVALEDSLFQNLTIITNAVNIAQRLLESRKSFKIILTGGIPREGFYECAGSIAERVIRQFNIDKFFMGVNGISPEGVFSFFDLEEAEISRTFLSQSKKSYVLADSSKFDSVKQIKVADFTEVDGVVSDYISKRYIELFEKAGLEVY
jgi:DeoR/GlpR family transcriptional regulator of sugar metabolism